MSNILIVESKNDEFFIRALVRHLNLKNVEIDKPICRIDDYECLNGLNLNQLILRFEALKNSLPKKYIERIGVILDHDGKREERLRQINNAIQEVFHTAEHIQDTGQFINISAEVGSDNYELNISCFLVNVNETGELETVIKAIKAKPSIYADCLIEWRRCLEEKFEAVTDKEKQKILSDKEFDKFWLNNYIRFDTCSKKEKKQARRKCSMYNFEYILENKKEILDFDHPMLVQLKEYLRLF